MYFWYFETPFKSLLYILYNIMKYLLLYNILLYNTSSFLDLIITKKKKGSFFPFC